MFHSCSESTQAEPSEDEQVLYAMSLVRATSLARTERVKGGDHQMLAYIREKLLLSHWYFEMHENLSLTSHKQTASYKMSTQTPFGFVLWQSNVCVLKQREKPVQTGEPWRNTNSLALNIFRRGGRFCSPAAGSAGCRDASDSITRKTSVN